MPSAQAPPVRRLEPADLAWATTLLAAACAGHPVLAFCCTGPNALAQRAWLLEQLLRFGLRYGRVYANADATALAVWLGPSHLGATRWPLLSAGLLPTAIWRLGWLGLRRLQCSLRATALLALAVHPARRGQGCGRRLLQATLVAMQATASAPCYLDVQGAEQLPFFQRLGFRLMGQCPAGRGGEAPTTWGLLRMYER
jgi:GNAT superfamily N-acetyltransferase